MENLVVNDKPAVKIFGRKITATGQAYLFNCEGDQVWLPKSCVKILDKETILVEESMYKQKFES